MNLLENSTRVLWIFITTLIVVWIIRKFLENRKLPPGPYGYPIIGYIPSATQKYYELMTELAEKYGKIFSLSLAGHCVVILNEPSIARKVLSNPSVLGRVPKFNKIIPGNGGFTGKSGKEWYDQRRYCVTAMRNVGVGRGEWETMIHDEVIEMIKEFKAFKGKPVDYTEIVEFALANNLLSLFLGERLLTSRDSKDGKTVMQFDSILLQHISPTSLACNLPAFLTRLLAKFKIGKLDVMIRGMNDFEEIVRRTVRNHMETRSEDQKPNFIDYYLDELNRQKTDKQSYSEDTLVGNICGLYIGANDTTRSAIDWLFPLTAIYPDIQEKVHQEIDEIAGKDRLIHWDERNSFPYVMATINEAIRWTSAIPLFLPRRVTADIEIENYVIPKDSMVTVNNWKISRELKGGHDFKPERFLKGDRNDKIEENLIAFSAGKRNCPGEQVAIMTLFLFYTAIMQNFEIACPKGKTITLDATSSKVMRHPVHQDLCFIER